MNFNRKRIALASIYFAVCSLFLMLGPKVTSWNVEFAIFNLKIAISLFALYISTVDTKD